MLGHIGVNVRDLEQAKAYYDGLMPLLGFEPYIAATNQFAYRPVNSKPGAFLFFYPALEEAPYSRHHPGLQHLAFMVESRAAVHAVHAKVQVLGSEVVHPPRLFPQYRPIIMLHSGWIQKDSCWRRSACGRRGERSTWQDLEGSSTPSPSYRWTLRHDAYNWNVFFQIPGEPVAWVINSRILGLSALMSRCSSHFSVADTFSFSNSYTTAY